MIGWIYSVVGIWTGVTRGAQKSLEAPKTIVDTSNRFRAVSDVVCDDFMQFERHTDVKQVPSRLAAPSQVPLMPAHGHPAAKPDRAPAYGIGRSGLPPRWLHFCEAGHVSLVGSGDWPCPGGFV